MKILVTGATGVIGQSLIEMLGDYSSSIDATFYKNKPKIISRKNIKLIKLNNVDTSKKNMIKFGTLQPMVNQQSSWNHGEILSN